MLNFARITRLATTFPGTSVGTSYGTPAIKVGKKLLLRMHQKEDAIVVMLGSVHEQQQLIKDDPLGFFITDHYQGYAAVLVRPTLDEAVFSGLLERAWRRAAKKSDIAAYDHPA